jgi:hypothetical protein
MYNVDAFHGFRLAKRAADEKAEFYMRGFKDGCIALDEDGNHNIFIIHQPRVHHQPNNGP